MSHRFLTILRRLPQDLDRLLDHDAIHTACRDAGHRWRDRLLAPVVTLQLFVRQMLHRNAACQHVTHFAAKAFTASAYCRARQRLPLTVFQAVLRTVTTAVRHATADAAADADADAATWREHRVFVVDGSSVSMPDTPELRAHFGQPAGQKSGCGFPVAKLLALMDVASGVLLEVLVLPHRCHEMAHVAALHPALRPGDLLLGDRAFSSYAHLALCLRQGLHAVFRMHPSQVVDFTAHRPHRSHRDHSKGPGLNRAPHSRWLRGLGANDQLVEYARPPRRPPWMTPAQYAALPESIVVRELRYAVGRRGFRTRQITLVTTLLDAVTYPLEALARLYRRRWEVETHLRELKQTLGMEVLHCKGVEGILKELTIFALVYNLVRLVMHEAACRQGVSPGRISFIDALRWLLHAEPDDEWPALVVNPQRPDRYEPRKLKRRNADYPWLTRPRAEERKRLEEQDVVA
jgi:hypothetical protein